MKERVLIIPAFNEAKNLGDILIRLSRTAPDYDRIVINDGLTGRTRAVVDDAVERQIVF